jgi:hypothetical protein
MTSPRAIKDLTLQALNLLEMSYLSSGPDASRSSAPRTSSSEALAVQHRELITLCESPEVTGALVLANAVTKLALERRIPTLLVTARYSPVILVLTLLLWRAGIRLEDAVNPVWSKNEFARLTVAAREVAGAPLLVMSSASFLTSRRIALTVAADYRRCRIVIDAGAEPVGRLATISRAFGVPITIVSFTRGRSPA